MGSAVDLVTVTVRPEIEANLNSKESKLGKEICGWDKKSMTSSAYMQSLKGEDAIQ